MKCPVCSNELSEPLPLQCPHCGADLTLNINIRKLCREVKRNYRLWLTTIVILFVAALVLLIVRLQSPCPPVPENRDSISVLQGKIAALNDSLSLYKTRLSEYAAKNVVNASEYIIQPGDNLWLIAQKILGDGNLYPKIVSDNNIADPSLVKVGQKIIVKK
ncbi:MAG: LysM peptidoglycan-binding domain-containing protein [Bacteroidales bacterium]|nr:LysM peptidoglycan-binding domain-containing protein [Bacteroidales bacterium]NPV35040.1 LysM peptidoglycan-binding domain-containing protein [Bacteroidales bacterium]